MSMNKCKCGKTIEPNTKHCRYGCADGTTRVAALCIVKNCHKSKLDGYITCRQHEIKWNHYKNDTDKDLSLYFERGVL